MPSPSESKPESDRSIDIDRLHFLVHPGFGLDYSKRVTKRGHELFDRYDRKADEVGNNGMLLAYLWSSGKEEGSPAQRFVHERICGLKDKLRQRMIVVSDGMKLFHDEDGLRQDFARVRKIALARGFWIDEATDIVAYGESFQVCVPNATRVLMKALGSYFKPTISVHNTNAGYRVGETREAERARLAKWSKEIGMPDILLDWTVPDE